MKDIELNHLKYFYYTVLEGGVAQAADRLSVQQPVVSKMLKTLEEKLGQPLFWKKGRSKSLTDYGQLVFRHCQVIFGEVNRIRQVTTEPENLSGLLNVGGAEPIVNTLFSPVFKKLSDQFPKMNLNAYTSTQSHLLKLISSGSLEIGCFFYIPNLPKELEVVKTVSLPFRLIVKSSMAKNIAVLESFIGSREVDDTSTHSFPTLELVKKKYPKARITFSSNSITLHKQLVLQGKGISIMPEFLIDKELKKGQVVDVLPRKRFSWDLMFVKRKTSHLGVPGQSFLNLFSEH